MATIELPADEIEILREVLAHHVNDMEVEVLRTGKELVLCLCLYLST